MRDFTDFRSAKFHEICTQYVDLCRDESFRGEFLKNFPVRGRFFQKGNFLENASTTSNFRPP